MRVVLQRVTRAEVRVDGRTTGSIDRGFVILAGFRADDTDDTLRWMADKIVGLRLFPDPDTDAREARSSFSRDITETGGALLVVSQFTLYADARKGRRPGFSDAASPDIAVPLYERFVAFLRERLPGRVETGVFGAMMEVELVNDGPITLNLVREPNP